MDKTINQRIADLRKAKRLTQKQFAEKLNISDKLVSKWEQGDSVPSLEDTYNISKVFNLTLDYLVKGIESPSDTEALKPLPPPPPPFVDPVQKFIRTINDIISKNQLQKYKEQILPSSSADKLYELAERARKATLEDWEKDNRLGRLSAAESQYFEQYREDRRSASKPIDEKYWVQARLDYLPAESQNRREVGVFVLVKFDVLCEHDDSGKYFCVSSGISFGLNFDALLALDNFEVYNKLTALDIPVYFKKTENPHLNAPMGYFDNLTFTNEDYKEICKKIDHYNHDGIWKTDFHKRDFSRAPISYKELLSQTDLRFFSLLDRKDLDFLLYNVNTNHPRVWEVIVALIDSGATKTTAYRVDRDWYYVPDNVGTLLLYEFAKMKINKQ